MTKRMADALPDHVLRELAAFSKRILDVRQARTLSLRDVPRVTNGALSSTAVHRIEHGDRAPNITTLLALCLAYDCDIKLTRKGTIELFGTGLHTDGGTTK